MSAEWDLEFGAPSISPQLELWLATACRVAAYGDPANPSLYYSFRDIVNLDATGLQTPTLTIKSLPFTFFVLPYTNKRVVVALPEWPRPAWSGWFNSYRQAGMITGTYAGLASGYAVTYANAISAWLQAAYPPASNAGARFIVAGHALSGAAAIVLTQLLQLAYSGSAVRAVTFGCPRVGDAAFAEGVGGFINNIADSWDPVTVLPFTAAQTTSPLGTGQGAVNVALSGSFADRPGYRDRPTIADHSADVAGVATSGRAGSSTANRYAISPATAWQVARLDGLAMRWNTMYRYVLSLYDQSRRLPQAMEDLGPIPAVMDSFDSAGMNWFKLQQVNNTVDLLQWPASTGFWPVAETVIDGVTI